MMNAQTLPEFAPGLPAAAVDASLRQALVVCDRARECAVLWFAEVQRRGLFGPLGFASLEIYAVEGLGFSPNRYWQFKRLADDFDRLPVLREAVATGEIGWTKAQQVARVATPATQAAWVAKATVTGRRALEREVRQLRRRKSAKARAAAVVHEGLGAVVLFADLPPALAEPIPATITLRGDALQVARFEALLEKARKLGLVPAGVDRIEAVLAGLASLIEDQSDEDQGDEDHGDETHGDGTHGDKAHRDQTRGKAKSKRRSNGPAAQIVIHQCPDCGAAAAVTHRGELPLVPAQVAAVACDAQVRTAGGANKTSIPPRTRAAVLARDRHRCSSPGCRSTRFLEVHHVVPRARGGSNRAGNLVTLCSRCHRHAHEPAAVAGDRFLAPAAPCR